VLRPITVDPDFAVDVVPGVGVQLEEVLPEEVLPLGAVLLLELPLHAAARSATAAIAPSIGSRRRVRDIRKCPLFYRYQVSLDRAAVSCTRA